MDPTDGFSPREIEVMVLVGGNRFSYKRTGHELGISSKTVETYAVRVRDKSGLDLPPRDALTKLYWESLQEAS